MAELKTPELDSDIYETDIVECLETILGTYKGTAPMDRDFGMDPDVVSMPQDVARAVYAQDVIDQIEAYEPRVTVTEVTFKTDEDNPDALCPVVHYERAEEDEGEN